jgi:hypothetical protein
VTHMSWFVWFAIDRHMVPRSGNIEHILMRTCRLPARSSDGHDNSQPVVEGVNFDSLTKPLDGEAYDVSSPSRLSSRGKQRFAGFANPFYSDSSSVDLSAKSQKAAHALLTASSGLVMTSGKSIVHTMQMRQALLTSVDGEHMLGDVRSELEAKLPPNPFLQVSFSIVMDCVHS